MLEQRWNALEVVAAGLAAIALELEQAVNERALDSLLNERHLHGSVRLGRAISRRPIAVALEFVAFDLCTVQTRATRARVRGRVRFLASGQGRSVSSTRGVRGGERERTCEQITSFVTITMQVDPAVHTICQKLSCNTRGELCE